jgi:hypothetical protein
VRLVVLVGLITLGAQSRTASADPEAVEVRVIKDGGEHSDGPCHDMPWSTCHPLDSVRTRWGVATVYGAKDAATAHDAEARRAAMAAGEYLAMYVLELPGKRERSLTEVFTDGAPPNAHHSELCGSATDWCQWVTRTAAKLSIGHDGAVTLVIDTTTIEQRWVDDRAAPHGERITRTPHRRVRTVRCAHTADGWQCTAEQK